MIYRLLYRLSAILGTQVVEVDGNKSDLTDSVKPTKVAEDYRAIFDNEYQIAHEELEIALKEAKVLVYLGKITWVCLACSIRTFKRVYKTC